MNRGSLACAGVALCFATQAGAARPKLSDLPQGKRAPTPSQALPGSIPAHATVPGVQVIRGPAPPPQSDVEDAIAEAHLADSMAPQVTPAQPAGISQAEVDVQREQWVTVLPKHGCVAQPNQRGGSKAMELPRDAGVQLLELTRVEHKQQKSVLITTWVALDTATRGVKRIHEQRTALKHLGNGAGKFALYGYRTADGIELVASAPGTQMHAAGRNIGGFSECGLLQTTLSTKRSAAAVDIGAERQLPPTKDEKRDIARGVAVTTHLEASFAHVSVSKLGSDKQPVLSVVVRKESGHRFSPAPSARPIRHGMFR
ncbi:MAG TPA: hypothetical protein PKD61_30410 [Polyangiaceae bacterium]|nr:hypothetical protein [Polyangiaceae bacterium]